MAGPGFINITLDSASAAAVVDTVLAAGAVTDADKHLNKVNEYGRNDHLGGQTLNLEFVSANPTGPIHIGGTRWAAVGDAMARVLEPTAPRWCANTTSTTTASRSTASPSRWSPLGPRPITWVRPATRPKPRATATRVPTSTRSPPVFSRSRVRRRGPDRTGPPRSGLNDDGEPLGEADTEVREEFRKRAVPMMFDEIQKSMKDFRVNFDVWFHENSLYADGKVDAAIEELKSRGDIFDKDGATWFESTNTATTRTV